MPDEGDIDAIHPQPPRDPAALQRLYADASEVMPWEREPVPDLEPHSDRTWKDERRLSCTIRIDDRNAGHTRFTIFVGRNPDARGNAGQLILRTDEFDEIFVRGTEPHWWFDKVYDGRRE